MVLVQTYFNEHWLILDHEEKFHYWLVPAKTNTQARCKRFKTTFELSNIGIRAVRSHAMAQKHLHLTNKITHFFKYKQSI